MKLKFDSNLEFQLDAIRSVTDLLEGLPKECSGFTTNFGKLDEDVDMHAQDIISIGNNYIIPGEKLLANLQQIQSRNRIPKTKDLSSGNIYSFPNFSVEMETGTGKTYVYLRTIFELNKLYGYSKFIIVVPSVAIREGVTTSIKLMKEHFKGLYNNVSFDDFVYKSKDLSRVRTFAVNNEIQIMVINIQAFQKDAGEVINYNELTDEQKKKLNIIHKEHDKMSGKRPIEFIQSTSPIVIIDEPQSVDNTEKSQKAIKNLNPLFCLRYSATHTNPYNLVYQLDPIRAYDMHLVKQIEVVDASDTQDYNQTFVRLDAVGYWPKTSKSPQAKVTIFKNTPNGPQEISVPIKHGMDLSQHTNRSDYDNYLVININAEPGNEYIEFQNGIVVELFKESGGMNDERLKSQIRQTIEAHMAKEKKLKGKGIKVLSLFFVDHVKSYRTYDESGNKQKGKIALWFEELYEEISKMPMYKDLLQFPVEDLHDGYFSADRKKGKIVELLDTTGNTEKDNETYELIMRDKERLLSLDVPLRFIFSHSALKEGWDNPNVFQICNLREIGTDRERRQSIGRGLRLPVNQDGDRIFDEQINRLTVIANETFETFAKGLQSDIEEAIDPSGNFKFGRIAPIAFTVLLNAEGSEYLTQSQSEMIWNHLRQKGFIDEKGEITNSYQPNQPCFTIEIPNDFDVQEEEVINRINKFVPRDFVKDPRKRQKISYRKRVELNPEFRILWEKISQKTHYSVEFETQELISKAVSKIQEIEEIRPVQILITKRDLLIKEAGIESEEIRSNRIYQVTNKLPLPDILSHLQQETELTRKTLVEILKKSGKLNEFAVNPQMFMTEVAKHINRALNEMIIDGIKYEPFKNEYYEMKLFEDDELEGYLNKLYEIQNAEVTNDDGTTVTKTPYDYIEYQSQVEKDIATLLDHEERVKFFCKLPTWFKVPTPLGEYIPDWAVVLEGTNKLYLVRESKSTLDHDKLRINEAYKIKCGKAHFTALGVDFKVATNINEVLGE